MLHGSRTLMLGVVVACALGPTTWAQHIPFPRYAEDGERILRVAVQAGPDLPVHLAMAPLTYSDVDSLLQASPLDDWRSRFDRDRLRARLGQAPRREAGAGQGFGGWLRSSFYRRPGYAIAVDKPSFTFRLNPVLDLVGGRQSGAELPGGTVVQNTRGLTAWGTIDDRVSFQTTFYENQAGLPSWEREWSAAYDNRVPGVGFYKRFRPQIWDSPQPVDYIQATGEVGVRLSRHINVRVGHGNPRLGLGYRSMLLDDFVDPFLYAQIDTRIWRFHYRNLYTQLQDGVQTFDRVERKSMVAHTLSLQLARGWEVGVTEQTVFKRETGFDAQYLNPIIFYRAVEQDNGSPDNALLGAHTNLAIGKTAMLYGQFLFDEFRFQELVGGNGWWANKYSWQLGGRYFNALGVTGLDVGGEYNLVRPFTYGHRRAGINYAHYSQPLAHPWGADLRELVARISYTPVPKWRIAGRFTALRQGDISAAPDPNIGANTILSNGLRGQDFGYGLADDLAVQRTHTRVALEYSPIPGSLLALRYDYYARTPPDASEAAGQHGVTLAVSLNAVRRSTLF